METAIDRLANATLLHEHERMRWDAEVENARRLAADRLRLNTLGTAAIPAAFYFAVQVGSLRESPWILLWIGFGVFMTAFGLARLNQSVSADASTSRVVTASELLEFGSTSVVSMNPNAMDSLSETELRVALTSQVGAAATVFLGINQRRARANREGMNALSTGFLSMFGGLGLHWLLKEPIQW
jgi:hypothetical protein